LLFDLCIMICTATSTVTNGTHNIVKRNILYIIVVKYNNII